MWILTPDAFAQVIAIEGALREGIARTFGVELHVVGITGYDTQAPARRTQDAVDELFEAVAVFELLVGPEVPSFLRCTLRAGPA